jgi:Zn-dependent M28 family amino/carboxypeptidase
MRRLKHFLVVFCNILFISARVQAQDWFSAKLLANHIAILAADSMEGRATGSRGEQKSALYIVQQFNQAGLSAAGDHGSWLQSFEYRFGEPNYHKNETKAHNVIGFLDNKAPLSIIIGAHYDHLGDGTVGHSLLNNPAGQIHNGADDNASGIAGLIELARYYSRNDETERFNFLFIAFSGEEQGLLGSDWFVNNPTIDLSTFTCMLNMDMV